MCAPPHEPTETFFEDSAEFAGPSVSKALESLSDTLSIGGNSARMSITKIIADNVARMSSNSGADAKLTTLRGSMPAIRAVRPDPCAKHYGLGLVFFGIAMSGKGRRHHLGRRNDQGKQSKQFDADKHHQ